MAGNYEKFVYVLSRWPVNPNKPKSIDFGYYLLQFLKNKDHNGNIFSGSTEENSKKLASLLNLSYNTYGLQNKCNQKKGASGLELKTVSEVLEKEYYDQLK